jgi:hypothetical protein
MKPARSKALKLRLIPVSLMILTAFVLVPSGAQAAPPTYAAVTIVEPKHVPVGGEATLVLQVDDVGVAPAEGGIAPIVVTDVLPAGLQATAIASPQTSECELATLTCSYSGNVPLFEPGASLTVDVSVRALPGVTGAVTNQVSVAGGGSTVDTVSREAVLVSDAPVGNGVGKAPLTITNEDGSPVTRAGSHPFELTSTIVPDTNGTKDLQVELPNGLLGNTNVIPQCSTEAFEEVKPEGDDGCPSSTAIGVAIAILSGHEAHTVPLFNLVPSPGEPARFGFEVQNIPVILDTSVRTGHGYGVTVNIHNVPQLYGFEESQVTFWGVPGETVHNRLRGWACLQDEIIYGGADELPCDYLYEAPSVPFLTLPTACGGPEAFSESATGDTWSDPSLSTEPALYTPLEGMHQCAALNFEPKLAAAAEATEGSTPTGLHVDVHQTQSGALSPVGTVDSAVKNITVTLPEGVALNPGGADGLQACTESEIGYQGQDPVTGEQLFTPALPEPLEPGVNFCPDASKVATVTIHTPLLPNPLTGEVYLASPQNEPGGPEQNPFRSLIALYIVARDPVSGVLVKLPAQVSLDPVTGQITATIVDSPQVPFEDAELEFFGGARAPLATPEHCGSYTTNASFSPWSETPETQSSSAFEITSGPGGSACPAASGIGGLPFNPSLSAGVSNINAGAFTPLATTITREDGQQNIGRVTLKMPPGLTGILTGVPLCHEAEANAGTCPAASKIGSTIVSVGLGGDPYSVTGGEVFLTEKYEGAPFGLSIVNPAVAGPFNLGKVIVRAKIEVNRQSAALTVTTGEIPHILDGIPLQIKHIHVEIERAGFIVNPTSCAPSKVTGNIDAAEGASGAVEDPFQVTNCASLKFEPKVEASVNGQVTKANGTSFAVKISKPAVQGEQADLQKFEIELPKQLPSRLTTLQKACTKAQFEANPGGCPAASVVGHMRALTPLLPVPVQGPLYFVSNGSEAFPNLIAVLQGYGVTIDLTGTTYISKAGITSSTFGTVPDVPFTFAEAALHNGPYSALTGLGSLCADKLAMPTEMIGQNGATLHESTKIAVTGCAKTKAKAKAKALTRAQKLKKALAACRKDRNKTKRARCEKAARKRYGPAEKSKKKP